MPIPPELKVFTAVAISALVAVSSVRAEADNQKRNLPEKPLKPRFELRDRDWPANAGDASICLWKDDALAAFTIAIDDNCASNIPWWMEMCSKYGLRPTWFIVTDGIGGPRAMNSGTWDTWKKVSEAGFDVQSHTVHHLVTDSPTWKNMEADYAESKEAIEANIPGIKCLTLAYPGGKGQEMNDPALAAKYYIGARSTRPFANPANQINYMEVNASSQFRIDDAEYPTMNLNIVFDPSPKNNLWRGWSFGFLHYIKPDDETHAAVEKKFAYVLGKVKSNDLWPALFREGCQYGQERDTAHLAVKERGADKIVFSLSDEMDDLLFDFPLTVKIRLDASWKTAKAMQGGKPAECKIVQHDGASYALVQAVPDRGDVSLVP